MKRETEFLYTRLASNLREQILSGVIKPGEFLLPEFEMAKHYGLSRISVRKSLDLLVNEGLLIKRAGQGTIVRPDLKINKCGEKTINILTTSPSIFTETCLPFAVSEFTREHPDIDIKIISIPIVMFWESLRNVEKSGLHPDILLVTDHDIYNMEYAGTFLDLQSHMGDELGSMYSKLRKLPGDDSALNSVPVTFSTIYLAYNPWLFNRHDVEAPDETWSEEQFLNAARRLTLDTDGDGITDLYGFSLTPIITRWLIIALQNGVDFRKLNENPAPLLHTFRSIHNMVYKDRCALLYRNMSSNPGAFFHEKAAMTLTSSLELASWRNNQIGFEPRVAPLPFGPLNSTLLLTNSMMIPASAPSPDLAVSFIKTVLSAKMQKMFCKKCNFLSVYKAVNNLHYSTSMLECMNISNSNLDNCSYLADILPDTLMLNEFEAEMELFWYGLESAEALVERLQELLK